MYYSVLLISRAGDRASQPSKLLFLRDSFGEPYWIRTSDLLIKSQLLMFFQKESAKIMNPELALFLWPFNRLSTPACRILSR